MADLPTRTIPPAGAAHETRAFDGPTAPTLPLVSSAERYELHTPIARGGMGEVFAAHDLALNREVAVKVLRDDLRDRAAIATRFVEEGRITAQLSHPAIPPIHDLGTLADGRPFIAMKLIKGRTLADLLAHARPDLPGLLAIFEQVCQAVAFTHERSVIHRDLKPGNVMVGKFNEVQVMDWGLAKVLGEASAPIQQLAVAAVTVVPVSVIQTERDGSSLTQAGSLLGTPAYMPPEQAKGDVDHTDARSDVFALGAVLCELLTGQPPYFAPSSAEIQALALTAQLSPAFARLDACGADAELIALAKRCLAPKPDERPANAGVVAKAVADHRAGVAERLRASELARARAEEKRKRARVQLALAGTVTLLLVAGGAFAWWQDRQAEHRKVEREREEERQQSERESAEARTREAVTAALNEAEAALRADDMPLADTALARVKERLGDAGPDDLRTRLADLSKDREMVASLEYLNDGQQSGRGFAPTGDDYSEDYPEVFRRYGMDLATGSAAELAERVNRSRIRAQLLNGLYVTFDRAVWSVGGVPAALSELLRKLDPDPLRTSIREAVAGRKLQDIAALVRTVDPSRLTPQVALLLNFFELPTEDRLRLLTAVWERHPNDFQLNATLCDLYLYPRFLRDTVPPEWIASGHTHARIMVALRLTSHLAHRRLGVAMMRAKRYPEALAALEKARTYAGRGARGLTSDIGELLREWKGAQAEIDYYQAELQNNKTDPVAHFSLGYAYWIANRNDEALPRFLSAIELDLNGKVPGAFSFATFLLERRGELPKALAICESVLQTAAGSRRSTYARDRERGRILAKLGRYREAVAAFEQARADVRSVLAFRANSVARDMVMAATGAGTDPVPPGDRFAVREKARKWLNEYLEDQRLRYELDPAGVRSFLHNQMKSLLLDREFTSVRHPLLLAALPPDEAKAWLELWGVVCKLRDEAEMPVAPMPRAK